MTAAIAARDYCSRLGWFLIAIPAKSKAPTSSGWNTPEQAISTPEQAEKYYTQNPGHNMGLLHSASGTCAIDIDHLPNTRMIFEAFGIDFDALMSSAPGIIGRAGRGKLLFKAPPGLATHKISWPVEGEAGKSEVIFELRAGGVQDVLPPSIHPDTRMPYTWSGPSVFDGLPDLPTSILTIWTEWERFRPQIMSLCPWAAKRQVERPPARHPARTGETSVIEAFNAAHSMVEMLERYGYRQTFKNRFLSPNSKSGLAGVVLFQDDTAYSHHASDPFDSAHSFDVFDLWSYYEHGGNIRQAVKAAAEQLLITSDPAYHYDPEVIEHGRQVAANILSGCGSRTSPLDPLSGIPEHLLSIPGVLQDAVNFYTSTAPKPQPQFAVQAALAFASVVLGRRWCTDQDNFTSLYFMNVGKSAAGKEHAKTTIERLLEATGLGKLIGPSGYTSASGVMSSLIQQPTHISIIDELGRVLQSSQSAGNHHKTDAQTILMEVFGRQSSTLRPQGYSKMGMSASQSSEMDKVVRNPSLTLLTMTTPSTLYDSLSSRYVTDGFLGRFLIVESHIGRQPSRQVRRIEPGGRLVEWAGKHATAPLGIFSIDTYDIPPVATLVPFTADCEDILKKCDDEMLKAMDMHDDHGLDAMFGRTKEIAQRLALIVALSCGEREISAASLQWAVDYATFYAHRAVAALKRNLADGEFHGVCQRVMIAINAAGLRGLTTRELSQKIRSFAALEPRKRKEVIDAIVSDHGVMAREDAGKNGPKRVAWVASAEVLD